MNAPLPRLVIIDGVRTPFCKMGTDLARLGADELGRIATQSLLARTGINPAIIDEVIFGCVGQPAEAANVARVIALRAGIPENVPAITVHRNCASGLEAFTQAYEKMCAGCGEVFLVGGTESMSKYPLQYSDAAAAKFAKLARAKTFTQRAGAFLKFRARDLLAPRITLMLGLTDPVCALNMGETAEILAREYEITRSNQDAFAVESHVRALAASEKLAAEICPVYPPLTREVVTRDNGPRKDSSLEALAKLRPVFDKRHGTVTAGNSSQITDGAVALLVMTETKAAELGLTPLGALTGYAYAGCDPQRMGLGPVYAIAKAEQQLGITLEHADLVEINEAFAAQVLACLRCLKSEEFARQFLGRDRPLGKIEKDRLNVNGGSIALGHPVGATGARLILTSLKELARRGQKRALVSVCVGGGQGAAVWLERM
ncbi:MAG: acetyl-CoA C-acetyltransferase [Verrucomicrobiota bacterium]|jgi:acetyl-CoA C-acetyltransferase/acetyl-CoA acyltransferase